MVWVGYSLGPGSTVDLLQGSFDEIFAVMQIHGWDQSGSEIIARAVQLGFDTTEVDDDRRSGWAPAPRNDSRNGGAH